MQDMPEPVLPDKPEADVFVPVKAAAPVALGVVQVDNPEILQANLLVKLRKRFGNPFLSPELVARRERMAGVKADPDPLPLQA